MKEYIVKDGKKLRCGFTTGTCSAAAAAAATQLLITKEAVNSISVKLPDEDVVFLDIKNYLIDDLGASCCVKKDSGDDPDVTDGVLVYAHVNFNDGKDVRIDGGKGVGRVTEKGLDCKVGEAAINSIPRKMIKENIRRICDKYSYKGGIDVIISVPEGEKLAKKTFNPQLGIVGGISILGTTGIVEPMSEKALVDSIKVEMRVIKEKGYKNLLAYPGNYAKSFIDKELGIRGENSVKFSNYLGEVLDYAVELDFKGMLIVGHIGKMVKVAGGMMNTHSHNGDFRMEILSCYAALFGGDKDVVKDILSCVTTEQAIEILKREKLDKQVIKKVCERAEYYINKRVDGKIITKLIIYSNEYGILTK